MLRIATHSLIQYPFGARLCAPKYVRMHSVLWRLMVHPVLHAAHFAAPSTRQPGPISATPLLHAHTFTATRWYNACARALHYRLRSHTRKRAHVPLQAVLAGLMVHPVSQESHSAAPFVGQSAPVCSTPFSHVQMFPKK